MMQQAELQAKYGQPGDEKRAERRRKVLKGGTILFNKGYASFGCRIRNLTEHGAMVEMETTGGIPSEFEFRVSNVSKPVTANIIWREPTRMGLQFL